MKKNLKPCVYKQRTDLRVTLCGKVKVWEDRSRSESESEEGDKLHDVDPKPGDLSMARLK